MLVRIANENSEKESVASTQTDKEGEGFAPTLELRERGATFIS